MDHEFERMLHEAGHHLKGLPVPDTEKQRAKLKRRHRTSLSIKLSAAVAAAAILIIFPFALDNSHTDGLSKTNETTVYVIDNQGNRIALNDPTQAIEYAEMIGENSMRYPVCSDSVILPCKHTIVVPKGAEFSLTLSDGTIVRINSGSSLTYPPYFTAKGERTVTLNYGEIFLNVAHDADNPFVVKTALNDTKVLGTRFNVQMYDHQKCDITLVEGKVAVKYPEDEWAHAMQLEPGENAAITTDVITVARIDVLDYVAWVDGYYYYDLKSAVKILEDICLRYDYSIEGDIPAGDEVRFWFNKNEDMDEVIMRLGYVANIDIKIVDNNRIILKN